MTRWTTPVVAALLASPALPADPDRAATGPLAVGVADDVALPDARRKRDVPLKAYFPEAGGPYPVIVFSHGFGGDKAAFGPVARHWASHGYVVLLPSHRDGAGKSREPADGPGRAGGLLGGMSSPQKIADRVADVVLVLDALDDLPGRVPGLKGKVDKGKVGVGGHSFGAYTAMLVGGVTVDLGGETGKSYRDERVRCVLPVSAQGTGQQGLTARSWEKLAVPMMTVTGTRDRGAGGQGVDWKKEPFTYSPAGDKYLVVIEGAHHVSFGGELGARGEEITRCVRLATTAFWDAYLKGDKAAREYLGGAGLGRDTAGKAALDRK